MQTEAIETAYQELLQACKFETDELLRAQRVRELNRAYEHLSNSQSRANYDAALSQGILHINTVRRKSEFSAAFIGDDSQTLLVYEREGIAGKSYFSVIEASDDPINSRREIDLYFEWIKPLSAGSFIAINSDGCFMRFRQPTPLAMYLGVEAGITRMSFSTNGNIGASYSYEDATSVWIWDLTNGQLIERLNLQEGTSSPVISRDGKYVITEDLNNNRMTVWDSFNGRLVAQTRFSSSDDVEGIVSVNASNKCLCIMSNGRCFELDIPSGKTTLIGNLSKTSRIDSCALSPNNRYLAYVRENTEHTTFTSEISIWDLNQRRMMCSRMYVGDELGPRTHVRFSADNRGLVVSGDGTYSVWYLID